ncbi:hypothetical protein FGRMN_4542 [Fusarium graminum]|nr:hypothetical protein FGRMN_4542 [Fusarium graminum]
MAEENDARPIHSPYASHVCPVYFQGNGPLYIPRDFLKQSPELASGAAPNRFTLTSDDIHVKNIAFDAGHVIIHYLITKTYQNLKPTEIFAEKNDAMELATAIRVYGAAESISLGGLRNLAREEIVRLGDKLELSTLVKVMEDAIPSFQSLPGISAYIESRIISFMQNSSGIAADRVLEKTGVPDTLSNVLLRSIALLKASEHSLAAETTIQYVAADRSNITLRPVVDAIELAETRAEARIAEENLRHAEETAVACEVAEIRDLKLRRATRGKLTSTQKKRLKTLLSNAEEREKAKAAKEVIETETILRETSAGNIKSDNTFGTAEVSFQHGIKTSITGESSFDKNDMNNHSTKAQDSQDENSSEFECQSGDDTDQFPYMVYPMTPSSSQASSL